MDSGGRGGGGGDMDLFFVCDTFILACLLSCIVLYCMCAYLLVCTLFFVIYRPCHLVVAGSLCCHHTIVKRALVPYDCFYPLSAYTELGLYKHA
jgi:hypothetical protein